MNLLRPRIRSPQENEDAWRESELEISSTPMSTTPPLTVTEVMDKVCQDPFFARHRNYFQPSENGCLVWTGVCNGHTPMFPRSKKYTSLRRHIYEHFRGPIAKGEVVKISCQTPLCVHPDHLYLNVYRQKDTGSPEDTVQLTLEPEFDGTQATIDKLVAHPIVGPYFVGAKPGKGGCILYAGRCQGRTPTVNHLGTNTSLIRLVYSQCVGLAPKRARVRRTCSERLCINPDHIALSRLGETYKLEALSDIQISQDTFTRFMEEHHGKKGLLGDVAASLTFSEATGCWLTSRSATKGCPAIGKKGRKFSIRRLLYEWFHGAPETDSLSYNVCGDPRCVSPFDEHTGCSPRGYSLSKARAHLTAQARERRIARGDVVLLDSKSGAIDLPAILRNVVSEQMQNAMTSLEAYIDTRLNALMSAPRTEDPE